MKEKTKGMAGLSNQMMMRCSNFSFKFKHFHFTQSMLKEQQKIKSKDLEESKDYFRITFCSYLKFVCVEVEPLSLMSFCASNLNKNDR